MFILFFVGRPLYTPNSHGEPEHGPLEDESFLYKTRSRSSFGDSVHPGVPLDWVDRVPCQVHRPAPLRCAGRHFLAALERQPRAARVGAADDAALRAARGTLPGMDELRALSSPLGGFGFDGGRRDFVGVEGAVFF